MGVAALMELFNSITDYVANPSAVEFPLLKFTLQNFVLLLSPFAPHISEELWEGLGESHPIFEPGVRHPWPSYDPGELIADEMIIVIQVNGKLRGKLEIPYQTGAETIKQKALDDPKVRDWILGKKIEKVIYVEKKLVNIVIK